MLFWSYVSRAHFEAGAIAPVPLNLPYGKQRIDSPLRLRDYAERWRRLEAGDIVEPSDCRPVRLVAHYGFVVSCPGRAIFRQIATAERSRVITSEYARYGQIEVAGDAWPKSDSLRVASWIAGSRYVKIQTGILIAYPTNYGLYQGPLPNNALLDIPHNNSIMSGVETALHGQTISIFDKAYAVAELNAILMAPPTGEIIDIPRGAPICWFFPVPKPKDLNLREDSSLG